MHSISPPRIDESLARSLYDRSHASRWGLSPALFHSALEASAAHAFNGESAAPHDLERYLRALHLEDLALASACAAGEESAWNHFVLTHRPALYRAADAIDPTGGARELADSLYGDLFGLRERDGVRQSVFRFFHGRSSLTTWLRAVLSQRHVDRLRATRRIDPLPDDDSPAAVQERGSPPDPERPGLVAAMRQSLAAAVATLEPRDHLRLRCYYVEELTLAAIGRLFKEHEATVSRHLARARRLIRTDVEARLRTTHGLDEAEIAQCFLAIVNDPGPLDLAELVGAVPGRDPGRKNGRQDRSKR